MRFLFVRRYNLLDMLSASAGVLLVLDNQWLAALIAIVALAVVSVAGENHYDTGGE